MREADSHDGYSYVMDKETQNSNIKQSGRTCGPIRRHALLYGAAVLVVYCMGSVMVAFGGQLQQQLHLKAGGHIDAAVNSGAMMLELSEKTRNSLRFDQDNQVHADASFHLTTWPKKISDGGDLVVFWDGTISFQSDDYLTLSCGPTRDENDYLQRKNVTRTDFLSNSVRFSGLYMMRCNYTVVYFNYQPQDRTFKAVATIQVGLKDSFNSPKHGHLALTTSETEMAIMFNSASSRTPKVRYGTSMSELKFSAEGTSTTYKASDMCHAPATITAQRLFRDPGFMHTVLMKDLKPDALYFYQYGNNEDGWSEIRSFRSRPAVTNKVANFIAYADMGVDDAPAAQSTAGRVYIDVVRGGYDSFLLHFGDISYARGEGSVWDKFFHIIEPYATRTPYMVSIGNHEYDYTSGGENDPSGAAGESGIGFHPYWGNYGADSLGECSVPMHHRWHVPATGNSLYWYSFNYGGVHVVQISTEHNWTRGSEQYEWLKKNLENVNRTVTPWVVLTAHRMMYSTQLGMESDIRVANHFREEVEDLIYENQVNLVMVGHQHAYERSCPVYHGECVQDGKAPVHITVGSAGFGLDTTDFSTKYGNWSVRHVNEYGYLRVASTPDVMNIQFVLNKNGDIYDELSLKPWV